MYAAMVINVDAEYCSVGSRDDFNQPIVEKMK